MGAWKQYVVDKGFSTSAAVTQYYVVKRTAAGSAGPVVGPVTAVTDVPFGVAQEEVTTAEQARGKQIAVALIGISVCIAGAAITAGQRLTLGATGKVVPAVAASSIVGLAMSDASGDGKQVSVLLALGSPVHP
jgi:hypothetical protein